jgi:hypothetical protein
MTINPNALTFPPLPRSPILLNSTDEVRKTSLSFDDFTKVGFQPISANILRGPKGVYIYFVEGKAYLAAPSNCMTQRSIYESREFVCFQTDAAHNGVSMLYKFRDNYKSIFQDGNQMIGKGEKKADEMICQSSEEEIKKMQSVPLSAQLPNLGFSEINCNQQLYQTSPEKRKKLIEGYEKDIASYQKASVEIHELFNQAGNKFVDDDYYVKKIQGFQERIDALKIQKDNIQFFTKIIADEKSPKIFLAVLKDNELLEFVTSIYRSDPRENNDISGFILSAEFNQGYVGPSFTIENEEGKQFKVRFENRDSEFRGGYFTVWCEPLVK